MDWGKKKILNYNSLGGWLIPIQIFLILNSISWLKVFTVFLGLLGEKDKLSETYGALDPSQSLFFIYYELISSVVLVSLSIVTIYYFFRRSRYFKPLMIIYLILDFLVQLISYFLFGSQMAEQSHILQKLAFSFVISLLISVYIIMSMRVRSTFVK